MRPGSASDDAVIRTNHFFVPSPTLNESRNEVSIRVIIPTTTKICFWLVAYHVEISTRTSQRARAPRRERYALTTIVFRITVRPAINPFHGLEVEEV